MDAETTKQYVQEEIEKSKNEMMYNMKKMKDEL